MRDAWMVFAGRCFMAWWLGWVGLGWVDRLEKHSMDSFTFFLTPMEILVHLFLLEM